MSGVGRHHDPANPSMGFGYASTIDGAEPAVRGSGRHAAAPCTGDDTWTVDMWRHIATTRDTYPTTADTAQYWADFAVFKRGVSRALDEIARREFETWLWPQITDLGGTR
ncbi:hypothetical protein [Xylanimonas protaetiae]|uniref:Uncharacterized protein n=1 Tax=Xylanimonas protaetiae TaxID=2509457 RepID=A0A4P6F3C9_9MICO|nr:hypothetical protein [Xylanimonas protaetiae]QAY70034.1 hypothetical protein ET471_08290 [Xylanimonas protaetiae]